MTGEYPKHPQGKGVGEVPLVPVMAVVANVIHNALGKRFSAESSGSRWKRRAWPLRRAHLAKCA
jgi:CO/xanthine dehydrogenase Mo-binding subunit